ncbi:hypothetical protein D3C86_2157640 [compost metagenome]
MSLRGVRTSGPMAPDIALDRQRPADYVFSRHVEIKLEEIQRAKPRANRPRPAEANAAATH